ncbi:MAG: GAF domain-containing protein [Verrucomicrobia bacterium]|nr:GAF domain-containing protein [Verrucomicrobiota bacterium]MDA1065504.1 GAF domain-containing protein [Verrucomicrobiota bacterium]
MSKTNERDALIDLLYRIRVIGHDADNPQIALESILELVIQFFSAFAASIALINPDTRELEIEVHKGLPENSKDLSLPIGIGLTGWVALHGKSLRVDDIENEPRYFKLSDQVKSELACPMEEHGQVIGVISIDSDRKNAFSKQTERSLEIIAKETTQIVSQIWLIQTLKNRSEQLEALISMGQDLVSKMDLDELLETINGETHKIMRCRLSMLLTLNPEEDALKIHSIKGNSRDYAPLPQLAVANSSFGAAIQLKRPVEVVDLRKYEDEHFWDIVNGEKLLSMICCPIIWEGKVIGILASYSDKVHRVNNDEKRILTTLASFSAVAIQNLRLYFLMFENEEHIQKNDKLITLGLLAAEIAHEIRNPLTVIKLLFGSLDLHFEDGDERKKDAKIIGEKIGQLESIVEQVLDFGKTSETLHSNWNLQQLIEESMQLVRLKLIQSKITIHFDRGEDQLVVDANKGQLQQVILNLILNATQAIPDTGEITFRCSKDIINGQACGCIEIEDTGAGIPEDFRNKIFDSFLTGRPGGTGLGLSIVKRILRSHQGDIEVKATGPNGTTMKLWVPLSMG